MTVDCKNVSYRTMDLWYCGLVGLWTGETVDWWKCGVTGMWSGRNVTVSGTVESCDCGL